MMESMLDLIFSWSPIAILVTGSVFTSLAIIWWAWVNREETVEESIDWTPFIDRPLEIGQDDGTQ